MEKNPGGGGGASNQRNFDGIGGQNYGNMPIIDQIRNKQIGTVEQVVSPLLK